MQPGSRPACNHSVGESWVGILQTSWLARLAVPVRFRSNWEILPQWMKCRAIEEGSSHQCRNLVCIHTHRCTCTYIHTHVQKWKGGRFHVICILPKKKIKWKERNRWFLASHFHEFYFYYTQSWSHRNHLWRDQVWVHLTSLLYVEYA